MALIDDEKRIDDFLEILSEEIIANISAEFEMGGGLYNDWAVDVLKRYRGYIKMEKAHYVNVKVENKFKNLNDAFKELDYFFIKNFAYIKIGEGMRYALLPNLCEKEETKWLQEYQKFHSLFQEFLSNYKIFIKTVKTNSVKPEKIIDISKKRNLIEKDVNGDFYHKNKIIKFKNKETIYYLIFKYIYGNSDLEGFCSYENINRHLEENGEDKYDSGETIRIRKRIRNGIGRLFRFSNLTKKMELIDTARGRGIIFNNPPL